MTFFYRWDEISPVVTALLVPPPKPGDEYLANAVLSRTSGGWELTSLETRDFDEPLARLQSIASGVLR